ncbi:hypothetical protein PIB30_040468 [Stylosanthes scabra]|uniref:Uncharacterized protein n=1 Tax=Stylosanthes scabra TaxID=79078 RepID=A0ABU6XE72_9FABA|nr:hypothetical protein [Stylosanthes scabra]
MEKAPSPAGESAQPLPRSPLRIRASKPPFIPCPGGSILIVKFLDPLAGLLVSGMSLKAGAETGYQSIFELMDTAIPPQHLDPIKPTVLQIDGVKFHFRKLKLSTLSNGVNQERSRFYATVGEKASSSKLEKP